MENETLPRLSLLQVKSVIEEHNEREKHAYVNRNVAVVKHAGPWLAQSFARYPFVLEEMRVLIVKRGEAHPIVNLLPLDIYAGELVFLDKNTTVEVHNLSQDLEGEGFSMSDEVFRLAVGETVPSSFDGHVRNFKITLKPEDIDFLTRLIDMLYHTIRTSDYSSRVFLSLSAAFLWYVDSLYKHQQQAHSHEQTREQQVFASFIALVNEYACHEHNLSFYADRLFLSLRYMSSIIKKVSGRSAKEWIDEALITAIKIDLRHTTKPLKQIADETKFPNMSFFSKFFKRMVGMTPMEYRRHFHR